MARLRLFGRRAAPGLLARQARPRGTVRLRLPLWGRRLRLAGLGLLLALGALFALPLPAGLRHPRQGGSLQILDRQGRLLREVLSPRYGSSRWVALEDISPYLVAATLAAEDRRFFYHPGVDPLAVARAAWANLRAGAIVQGGSTLTQQLVRNLTPLPRGLGGKVLEACYAVRLEAALSKHDILELYLNRVPYGNQAWGVGAAAQLYFAKAPSQLSLAEAAWLAVLPRAPGALDPYRSPGEVRALQRALLRRMAPSLDPAVLARALAEPVAVQPPRQGFAAPHFCDYVLSRAGPGGSGSLRTTLDLGLQETCEGLLRTHLGRLRDQGVGNGAVLVVHVPTGDILAMVGSRDYFDPDGGQVNAVLARRQPGSALKPFTYSLYLERGGTAASILPDVDVDPARTDRGFLPRNYDGTFHGPVRLRTALACSYNVAAVRVCEALGPAAVLERLRRLGFESLDRSPEHYGAGLTLGTGEVTLLELARAYRCLARGGRLGPLRVLRDEPPGVEEQVIDERVACVLTDILADPFARAPAFGADSPLRLPFPCAAKTGTSKDFRDNWCVGYSPEYVVAVWVGNFDASPMRDVSGITGAGPLFRDIFLALQRHPRPFPLPPGLVRAPVCSLSGLAPGDDCPETLEELFLEGTVPRQRCTWHRRLQVDTRTGRPAAADCPAQMRAWRVFEVYPPLYQAWAASAGRPLLVGAASSPSARYETGPLLASASQGSEGDPQPPGGRESPEGVVSPPSPAAVAPAGLVLAFPEEGAVFRTDPVLRRQYQALRLRALVPPGLGSVSFWVDGRCVGSATAPFEVRWVLRQGRHRAWVTARGPGGERVRSPPVAFEVR
jgi:penicillin-binding protein 1C